MSLYIGPQPEEFRSVPAPAPRPARSSARRFYPPGTILAASTLTAMTLMFGGLMAPTFPHRLDGLFASPLRFALGVHDLVMGLAHLGTLGCAIALLFHRPRAARLALLLVSLVWGANLAWPILFQQYDLIVPACALGLFSAFPLVYLLHSARRRKGEIPAPNAPGRRLIFVSECFVAVFVLLVSGSIAFERPLDQLLHGDGSGPRPARPSEAPTHLKAEPASQYVRSAGPIFDVRA